MKLYHYYVTFVVSGHPTVWGSVEYCPPKKIDSFEDITLMRQSIQNQKPFSSEILILDYKLIRDEPY